ncbi:MAG: hypothetical protein ACOYL6_04825 [Bacteriovoracaceae bacterium]
MILFIIFMASQWYLLGKEIDHRLKIYFRVNSSMDRLIYRCLLGNITLLILFNLMSLIPPHLTKHFFWGTWVILGLFYSWPTRGKIIEETVSSHFSEFNFLDSFERTILGMSLLLFLVSIPELPSFENLETLKLYFDPQEKIHTMFWNYLNFTYFPFLKFPKIFNLAWCLHFYVFGLGIYLMTFYAILRYFLSRRLCILGLFALLSSYSFSKILASDFSSSITTSFTVLWVWAILWTSKSSTYRIGLFIGLLSFWGMIINPNFIFLLPIQFLIILIISLEGKTYWFKRQFIKYTLLGAALCSLLAVYSWDDWPKLSPATFHSIFQEIVNLLSRKAFFNLSTIGLLAVLYYFIFEKKKQFLQVRLDHEKMKEISISFLILLLMGIFIESSLFRAFGLLWITCFLSLIPLEFIFQSISRLRSKRNMIYAIYILICLLDSHFEVRLKIFGKLFT